MNRKLSAWWYSHLAGLRPVHRHNLVDLVRVDFALRHQPHTVIAAGLSIAILV